MHRTGEDGPKGEVFSHPDEDDAVAGLRYAEPGGHQELRLDPVTGLPKGREDAFEVPPGDPAEQSETFSGHEDARFGLVQEPRVLEEEVVGALGGAVGVGDLMAPGLVARAGQREGLTGRGPVEHVERAGAGDLLDRVEDDPAADLAHVGPVECGVGRAVGPVGCAGLRDDVVGVADPISGHPVARRRAAAVTVEV